MIELAKCVSWRWDGLPLCLIDVTAFIVPRVNCRNKRDLPLTVLFEVALSLFLALVGLE